MSPISFALNYESRWVGASDNQLVDINKLLNLRTLSKAEIKGDKNGEYYLGIDVARSQDTANNISSVAVIKAKRNNNGKISQLLLVNLFTISNALNFTAQALEIKKIKRAFGARMAIVDSNGLGVGLVDELMKESFDPNTGESYECWNTINTDAQPETQGAELCLFDLKPQSANSEVLVAFIDMVESGKLRLLEKKQNSDYDINDKNNMAENIAPFIQTDFLVEEISNLQLKPLSSGKLTVERVIKKYGKDRFSGLAYILWYIKTYEDNIYEDDIDDLELLMQYSCL
jgi:ribonucleoside-diphosphate reductase alpha chain